MPALLIYCAEEEAGAVEAVLQKFDRNFIKASRGLFLLHNEVPGVAGLILAELAPLTHDHVFAFEVRHGWGTRVSGEVNAALDRLLGHD